MYTYKRRKFLRTARTNTKIGSFLLGFLLTLSIVPAFNPKPKALIYPIPLTPVSTNLLSGVSVDVVSPGQETGAPAQEEVKEYLRQIFGRNWKIAYAVAENECKHTRNDYPKCKNSRAKEHSIGLFQINIAKNEGQGAWVHWAKIPGNDLEEKEEWLRDWKNNALVAFVISQGGTNWNAWTAYTSGNYLLTYNSL